MTTKSGAGKAKDTGKGKPALGRARLRNDKGSSVTDTLRPLLKRPPSDDSGPKKD